MDITTDLKKDKQGLLEYFRERANEFQAEVTREYGNHEYKKKAKNINKLLIITKCNLIDIIERKAEKDNWGAQDLLESILMVTYCNNVVMLEYRNSVWPYEYMTFSRRIGELWEPFCKLPFEYSLKDIELFVPPLFKDVKRRLSSEIEIYISKLNITEEEKRQLLIYYNKVWGLVTSGEIKLELDLHFIYNERKYVVDFKSGFGSNEKGNTNRLLLVASIYHNLEDNYEPLIFVRSADNNNYFRTLKNSGIWQAYSGDETYEQIYKYSGYNIKEWISSNINWIEDFNLDFSRYINENNLEQYLIW